MQSWWKSRRNNQGEEVSNFNELKTVLASVDLVYANLAGLNIEDQAKTVGTQAPFKGTEVSGLSVADYIVNIIENPEENLKSNVGLDKPGTDGDKPAWY